MKLLMVSLFLCLFLLAGSVHAFRLTDGLFFTVAPNSTGEVYFILPDDLGAGPGKADYYVTTVTDWPVDLTEQIVTTEENNTALIPIKFYTSGKKEGDCSNYTIRIAAPSLNLAKSWKGGVCLSKYMDADISQSQAGGDAKTVLNENVDLFSAGFRTYAENAKPGEAVPIEILVQSQANLTIDVTLQSDAFLSQKSFVVQTGQGSEAKSVMVNASAAASGGHAIVMTAKARSCSLASCTKQSSMSLAVSDSGPQEGFSLSVFPDNIAIKSLEPVQYSFTLQNNYKDEANFIVNVDKPLDLDSSFVLGNFTVSGLSQRTVSFTVTPHNLTGFYEMDVKASYQGTEKVASAYLSTNEMVSDVYRNAADAELGMNSSAKAAADASVRNWYSSYSKSAYGSNTTAFTSLQDALDAARKQNSTQTGQPGQQEIPEDIPEEKPASSPFTWVIIPAVLAGAALVIVLIFKKSRSQEAGF